MHRFICLALIKDASLSLRNQNNRYIRAARDYIEIHYTESSLDLGSIAEQIGVSTNYLSKLFLSSAGVHYTEYLNSCRIRHATELLTGTTLPVNDIAEQCGFSSVQNFIRVFKKHTGNTPGKFRTDNKNK
jgi:YesN/AraC family two-component response regulator